MVLNKRGQLCEISSYIRGALPTSLILEIEKTCGDQGKNLEEIRLRLGRKVELLFCGTSVLSESCISKELMEEIFYKLCNGSVYAHSDTICRGYIKAADGTRIGVCGSAVCSGANVTAVHDITSISIRLPSTFLPDVRCLAREVLKTGGGMLIFSPPGVGKTTVLRSLICELSGRCGKRIGVIDTRGELSFGLLGEALRADILTGYPRGEGIEIAIRTLNPEYIVCDEIGSALEARSILAAANCGVSIIASAHGDDAAKLVRREGIAELYQAEIFSLYTKIDRPPGGDRCNFKIYAYDEIGGKENV